MLAVVTGATSGIGRSYAQALAESGYDLVITGRRAEVLREAAADLEAAGARVATVIGDMSDETVFLELLQAISGEPVTFLVNNAGAGFGSEFHAADGKRIDDLLNLLAIVPGKTIHAALPGMLQAGGGTVVNVGSLAGRLAVPGSSIYCAAKSYLERLSEALALELAGHKVVVQALIPGYVKTDFHRNVPNYKSKQKSRGLIRWMDATDVVRVSIRRAGAAARRLERGRVPRPRDTVVVPSVFNRILLAVSRFLPRGLLYRGAMNRPRME